MRRAKNRVAGHDRSSYPVGAVTFAYETGTLAITMLDIRNSNANAKRIPFLWAASINVVLTNTSLEGALTGIDQAFEQSPCLERQ